MIPQLILLSFALVGAGTTTAQPIAPVPFNSPFPISISINAYCADTAWTYGAPGEPTKYVYRTILDSAFMVAADTMIAHWIDTEYCSFRQDSIFYIRYKYAVDGYTEVDSLSFWFNRLDRTIPDLQYRKSYTSMTLTGGTAIDLHNIRYDSAGMFLSDSDYGRHISDFSYYSNFEDLENNSKSKALYAVSVDLGGIFRPTHLINPLASVRVQQSQIIRSSAVHDGSAEVYCTREPHSQLLEVFTPIGAKVSSLEIAADQTSVVVPHLRSGIYFLRLGNQVTKIVIL